MKNEKNDFFSHLLDYLGMIRAHDHIIPNK